MSFEQNNAPAPGWYPDPSGSGGQRWWDGGAWSEYVQQFAPGQYAQAPAHTPSAQAPAYVPTAYDQPYPVPGAIPGVPAGTPAYTWFIWIIVLLPLLSLVGLAFFDLSGYLASAVSSSSAPLRMMTSPGYLAFTAVGWISYFGTVALAFGDHRALTRLGYRRPFHWAWAFLGAIVYVIGRTVVVKRRSGRGLAPIWVMIAMYIVSFVVVVVKVAGAISVIMATIPSGYAA